MGVMRWYEVMRDDATSSTTAQTMSRCKAVLRKAVLHSSRCKAVLHSSRCKAVLRKAVLHSSRFKAVLRIEVCKTCHCTPR